MKTPSEKDKQRFQKAMQALHAGQPKEALGLFEKVRKASGDHPDIWYLMGLAHGKLGEMNEVKKVSMKALESAPAHFGALCNLANALLTFGDKEGALENYGKALKANPTDPTIINNYGRALGLLGRWDDAIEHFQEILERNRNYAPAHSSLGKAYAEGGYPDKAFKEYQKALALDSRQFDAHMGIGNLYAGLGGALKAEAHYKKALETEPNSLDARLGLASIKRYRGAFDEAIDLLDEADRHAPDMPSVLAAKADLLERTSRYDEAREILDHLKKHDCMYSMAISVNAALCRQTGNCDEALRLIEEAVEAPQYNLMEKQMLRFSAGKLLDKLDRFDDAFKWYHEGNETIKVPCDLDVNDKQAAILKEFYSESAMKSLPRATTGSSRPVFILGMPRSGTTLTEHILSIHPDVHGAGELGDLKHALNAMRGPPDNRSGSYMEAMSKFSEKDMNRHAQLYLDALKAINADARFVTDKMPHNFLQIGAISLLFPDAHIIHCRRDPLDNGLSIYFQNFSWTHDYATKLENIGRFYAIYDSLMKHWEKVVDIPILTVHYEEMVENQEAMSKKLLDFVGLEWDKRMLEFHRSERTVATASYDQVRQPIYKSSRERWRNYEKHLGPLKESLEKWCEV